MFLFIDTETTGLPRNWGAPSSDVDNWPRIVTASWCLVGLDRAVIHQRDFIAKPVGYEIPESSSRIHGVTHDKAIEIGDPICRVLDQLDADMALATWVIAHNLSFDRAIVEAEYHRANRPLPFESKRLISCTKFLKREISNGYCLRRERQHYVKC